MSDTELKFKKPKKNPPQYTMRQLMRLPSHNINPNSHFVYKDKPKDIVDMIHSKIREFSDYWKPQHDVLEETMRMLSDDAWTSQARKARWANKKPSGNFPLLQSIRDNIYYSSMIPKLTVDITAKDLPNESFLEGPNTFISDKKDQQYTTAQFYQGLVDHVLNTSDCASHFNSVLGRTIDYGYGGYLMLYLEKRDEFADEDDLVHRFMANNNPLSFLMDPAVDDRDSGGEMNWFIDYTLMNRTDAKRVYGEYSCFDEAPEGGDDFYAALPDYCKADGSEMVKIIDAWERRVILAKVVKLNNDKLMMYDDYVDAQEMLQLQGIEAVGTISEKSFHQIRKYRICQNTLLGEAEIIPGFNRIPVYPMFGKSFEDTNKANGSFRKFFKGIMYDAHHAQTALNTVISNLVDKVGRAPNNAYVSVAPDANDSQRAEDKLGLAGPTVIHMPMGSGGLYPVPKDAITPEEITLLQFLPDLIKEIVGVSHAAIGQRANEISGRAIKARKAHSDNSIQIYPAAAMKVVKRMVEDIITSSRNIYKPGSVIQIEDARGVTVPITVGKETTVDGKDGSSYYFDNDIDRNVKLDVTIEHTLQDESRREKQNEMLMEALQRVPDPAIASIILATIIKNEGDPGSVKTSNMILESIGNPKLIPVDLLEQQVRNENAKVDKLAELEAEKLDISSFDPTLQEPPPEVKIKQLEVEKKQLELQITQLQIEKEQQLAGIELDTAAATADGKVAAAQQAEANVAKAQNEVHKERIAAETKMVELQQKSKEASEDLEDKIKEVVVETLKELLPGTNTNEGE